MIKSLYPCFQHWSAKGSVYLYSDPHFSDEETKALRKDYIGDEEQVRRINSKVSKNDTIIFLGDIGSVEPIKRINGYKVLIMGNHDKGKTNYERTTEKVKVFCSHGITKEEHQLIDLYTTNKLLDIKDDEIENKAKAIFDKYSVEEERDNKLFDEVYEGKLQIASNIVLSHEPVVDAYAFNIHGHDHHNSDFLPHLLKYFDADMPVEDLIPNCIETIKKDHLTHFNICAEHVNYTPVSLKEIINSGVLKDIPDMHRATIDKATARKKARNSKAAN